MNPVPMGQPMYSVSFGQSINPAPMQQFTNPAPMGQNLSGMPYWQLQGLSQNEDRTIDEEWLRKKIAREHRKMVRQISRSSATQNQEERLPSGVMGANLQDTTIVDKRLFKFCTPDGTREAEENLPALGDRDKEGIQIELKDVYSDKVWSLKYK
ncbi:hypothetical protein L6164_036694 [Bauhinia variegata]|nr:hypothetical protein L6164_036694 [Bauhinia variegata]